MPLAAFDFDHTIIDVNSDMYINKLIADAAKPSRHHHHKYPAHVEEHSCWTQRMNAVFEYLHSSRGVTQTEYVRCLSEIQIDESMKQLLTRLKRTGYQLAIVSDANSFFIETILKENNLAELFDLEADVLTNKACFDSNGRLVTFIFVCILHLTWVFAIYCTYIHM